MYYLAISGLSMTSVLFHRLATANAMAGYGEHIILLPNCHKFSYLQLILVTQISSHFPLNVIGERMSVIKDSADSAKWCGNTSPDLHG